MNKQIFILAMAAIGFVACSSDETVASQATSEANEISFRPLINGVTRAADILSQADLESFNVYALKTDDSTPYIENVTFTDDGAGNYNSAAKYYWPSYNLSFYAWSANSARGDASEKVSTNDYLSYSVWIPDNADEQADFIYATNDGSGSGLAQAASVSLAFAHKESRIVLQVKNTAANVRFDVVGWRIGFAAYNGNTSDGGETWIVSSPNATNVYSASESKTVAANTAVASAFTKAQIMLPQALVPATAYASGETGAKVNNAYIAVKYKAQNTTTNDWVVGSAAADSEIYGIWPIPAITWQPGKQYTYTIDLADGGYYEVNTAAGTGTALDPILGNYIKFASVTVSNWDTTPGNTNLGM